MGVLGNMIHRASKSFLLGCAFEWRGPFGRDGFLESCYAALRPGRVEAEPAAAYFRSANPSEFLPRIVPQPPTFDTRLFLHAEGKPSCDCRFYVHNRIGINGFLKCEIIGLTSVPVLQRQFACQSCSWPLNSCTRTSYITNDIFCHRIEISVVRILVLIDRQWSAIDPRKEQTCRPGKSRFC